MPSTWQLAVWGADSGMPPGYAQVDMVDEKGVNHGSTSLAKLKTQGYDVPDVSRLPTGKYTADLRPMPKIDPRTQVLARGAPGESAR